MSNTSFSHFIIMSLCAYKDALGIHGQGIHSYRFFGFAIMDIILTILGAGIISYFSKYDFLKVLITLFILGIILHRLFFYP